MPAAIPAVDASAALARLTTFELLDEAGCEDWVLRVMLLRRHWRRRHPLAPFFTLGLAAYLDCTAAAGSRDYRDEATASKRPGGTSCSTGSVQEARRI